MQCETTLNQLNQNYFLKLEEWIMCSNDKVPHLQFMRVYYSSDFLMGKKTTRNIIKYHKQVIFHKMHLGNLACSCRQWKITLSF